MRQKSNPKHYRKGRTITSDLNGLATTRVLTRIIHSVWDEPKSKTRIRIETGISDGRKIDDAIVWLNNHNIIECIYKTNGSTRLWRTREDHRKAISNHEYTSPLTVAQAKKINEPSL